MSISLQLYEDSGPAILGRGTYRIAAGNIGWKSDGTNEEGNHYAFSPITRPDNGDVLWARSFKKYHFALINGTYSAGSRVRIRIKNTVDGAPPAGYESETTLTSDELNQKVRIFYKLSNTYEQPNDNWDGEMRFLQSGETILYPSLSTTGPEGVQAYPQYLTANTTYYTQYLITQLEVPYGTGIGNIGEVNIEWFVDESEEGDI